MPRSLQNAELAEPPKGIVGVHPIAVRMRRATATFIVCSLTMLGCGGPSGPQRVAVDGSILSSEKLLPNGTIRFLPEPGNNSPIAITTVTGGLYRFTEADGPYPGKYKVAVNLELDYSVLAKMSSSSSEAPPMNWEEKVTVPDQQSVTLHFDWPANKGLSGADVSPKTTP